LEQCAKLILQVSGRIKPVLPKSGESITLMTEPWLLP